MAHKKHGQLTTSPEWRRHLRPLFRRFFWKGERRAERSATTDASDREPDQESSFGQLRWCLQALAIPAEQQVSLLPDFTVKADELALDFANWKEVVVGNFPSAVSTAQLRAIESIDSRLAAFSRGGSQFYSEFWTEAALHNDPNWAQLRSLARAALETFGWPVEQPPSNRSKYVQSA